MKKKSSEIRKGLKSTNKKVITIYIILRALVILTMVRSIIMQEWDSFVLCILTLLLFTLPNFVQEKFQIRLPSLLEGTIYCFIFAAEILGEIHNFYGIIPFWDTILHTLNGFICAGIGFSLVDLLNKNSKRLQLSPVYVAIVGFCFSMTVGVCWEFIEFSADHILQTDMQKDTMVTSISSVYLNPQKENKVVKLEPINETDIHYGDDKVYVLKGGYLDIGLIDTMQDLFVNLLGALTFSIYGYFVIRKRDGKKLEEFVPQRMDEVNDD